MLRIWTRTSDRLLNWVIAIGAIVFVVLAVDLLTAERDPVLTSISLACGLWLVLTAWAERRRR